MKSTIILIIVLIFAGLGFFLWAQRGEAPAVSDEVLDSNTYNTPVTDSDARVVEFTIDAKNYSFSPNTIKVKKGDAVKITFKNSQGFHDLVIDEYNVAVKQIKTGEQDTITFTADKTGSFEYYCSVGTHRALGMVGTLVVE